jgi:hypothetical protein
MRGLAGDALECFERTLAIINADCFAVAVAKLKLGQIPVQVLFGAVLQVLPGAVLIDTPHATLEDAESAFNGVRGHIAAHVLLLIVLHSIALRAAYLLKATGHAS